MNSDQLIPQSGCCRVGLPGSQGLWEVHIIGTASTERQSMGLKEAHYNSVLKSRPLRHKIVTVCNSISRVDL